MRNASVLLSKGARVLRPEVGPNDRMGSQSGSLPNRSPGVLDPGPEPLCLERFEHPFQVRPEGREALAQPLLVALPARRLVHSPHLLPADVSGAPHLAVSERRPPALWPQMGGGSAPTNPANQACCFRRGAAVSSRH